MEDAAKADAKADASSFLKKMLPPPPRAPANTGTSAVSMPPPPRVPPNSGASAASMPPPPGAPSATKASSPPAQQATAFTVQDKAKKEECKDNRSEVTWDYSQPALPDGWKRVPSTSRPVSYLST